MKDQDKFQAELTETLTKLRDKYEATHDDLVKIVGYAMDNVKYPTAPLEGTPIPGAKTETKPKAGPNPVK